MLILLFQKKDSVFGHNKLTKHTIYHIVRRTTETSCLFKRRITHTVPNRVVQPYMYGHRPRGKWPYHGSSTHSYYEVTLTSMFVSTFCTPNTTFLSLGARKPIIRNMNTTKHWIYVQWCNNKTCHHANKMKPLTNGKTSIHHAATLRNITKSWNIIIYKLAWHVLVSKILSQKNHAQPYLTTHTKMSNNAFR